MALALGSLLGFGASVGGTVTPARANGSNPVFGHTVNLGPAGGEPSIQDDGRGNLYVVTPLGLLSSIPGVGSLVSVSHNGGTSFDPAITAGGLIGGGDTDMLSDVTGKNVYLTDLAATHANILKSVDFGATYTFTAATGYVNDRQWLTTIGPNVYLTYHNFAPTNTPQIWGSGDGGTTWLPLGFNHTSSILAPTDPAFLDNQCNTLVSKPVADKEGNLYVLSNTTTISTNIQAGCVGPPATFERFWMMVSGDGGNTFSSYLASDLVPAKTGLKATGSWGHTFNQLAIDAGGNLYISASGSLDNGLPLQNYLIISKDGGKTWSKPIATNPEPNNAQLFPAIAAGQAGQVAVGYYRGGNKDHHVNGSNFQFVVDQTFNALDANPTFTHTTLAPVKGTTPHANGICTDGLFCGTPASSGGNRNLLDFESMAVDPAGNLEVIIPADCNTCQGNTENWFYKQTAGPLMPPGPTNGNGTGNQTWVAGARTAPPPGPPLVPVIRQGMPNTSSRALWRVAGPELGPAIAGLVVLLAAFVGAAVLGRRRLHVRQEQ